MGTYIHFAPLNHCGYFTQLGESVLIEADRAVEKFQLTAYVKAFCLWFFIPIVPIVVLARFNTYIADNFFLIAGGALVTMLIPAVWLWAQVRSDARRQLLNILQEHPGFYDELRGAEGKELAEVNYERGFIRADPGDVLYYAHKLLRETTNKA